MIQYLKSYLKKVISRFGFDVRATETLTLSDDPIYIISKIIDPINVKMVIDGGASIGDTSERFSNLFPHATVHAFEPFPDFHDALRKKQNDNPNIKFHNYALGGNTCTSILNINESKGTNSLLKSNDKAKEIYGSLMNPTDVIEVKQISLDEWMHSFDHHIIDILKLDLQGGEFKALQGAKNVLKEGLIKSVICEFIFEPTYDEQPSWVELASYLEGNGLRLFNFYQPHYYNGQLIQADIIFLNQAMLDSSEPKRESSFFNFSNLLKSFH